MVKSMYMNSKKDFEIGSSRRWLRMGCKMSFLPSMTLLIFSCQTFLCPCFAMNPSIMGFYPKAYLQKSECFRSLRRCRYVVDSRSTHLLFSSPVLRKACAAPNTAIVGLCLGASRAGTSDAEPQGGKMCEQLLCS